MSRICRNLALAAFVAWAGASTAQTANEPPKDIPSKEALQRKTALKLAGLATFVTEACRDLNLNPDRFKAAVTSLGVTPDELAQKELQLDYLRYTMAYKQNVKANCERARTEFGPNGKTLPDLFMVAKVQPKPPAAGLPAPAQPTPKTPDAKAPEGKKP